ncbi:phytoene desaturase family protein [Jeotgalibacillus proteolyticus]|uniref:Phytoene desaturase n=1 Tax=Jeotgalibacillus proteolyticus TaxID=2082395 RepID=A0A2S5GHG8_9BACL|nr:phytoene desaturase family protein [Jeotgalibacillus proteolyticus]PPA72364.1 phytoene desaturase [Jeotgalibacillus proteolyticus]
MAKKIAIIGAGPGGLAAAMLLASKGYKIDVYEKQNFIGGRNSSFKMGGYTFDVGPTFLSMPEIAEELFEEANRNLHDYIDLKELPMMYELIFPSKKVRMYRDPVKMKDEIERHFPGDSAGYDAFMADTRMKMDRLRPILQSKMDHYYQYMSFKVLKALPQLSLGKSLYTVLSNYFQHEELKLGFTFQAKYLGMSPWECPGAFSILSFMEHEYGIFHPMGGVNQLSKAMARVVHEYGGNIHLGNGVKKLITDQKKNVTGFILEDGREVECDEVIINGDFSHVMSNLLDEGILKKYSPSKLAKKKYSCSTFMIYLGVNREYNLPHHTICFADDYKKNVEEITGTGLLSADPSIYIQNASVTDPTLAPAGKSALYILAPVPNNLNEIDWEKNEKTFRDLVLELVEKKTGFKNLRDHIEEERIISPIHWEYDFSVFKGATFSLGHQLTQMMALRPHNKFEELGSTWLVGGGTHPGSGLPTILESARITTAMMMNNSPGESRQKDLLKVEDKV